MSFELWQQIDNAVRKMQVEVDAMLVFLKAKKNRIHRLRRPGNDNDEDDEDDEDDDDDDDAQLINLPRHSDIDPLFRRGLPNIQNSCWFAAMFLALNHAFDGCAKLRKKIKQKRKLRQLQPQQQQQQQQQQPLENVGVFGDPAVDEAWFDLLRLVYAPFTLRSELLASVLHVLDTSVSVKHERNELTRDRPWIQGKMRDFTDFMRHAGTHLTPDERKMREDALSDDMTAYQTARSKSDFTFGNRGKKQEDVAEALNVWFDTTSGIPLTIAEQSCLRIQREAHCPRCSPDRWVPVGLPSEEHIVTIEQLNNTTTTMQSRIDTFLAPTTVEYIMCDQHQKVSDVPMRMRVLAHPEVLVFLVKRTRVRTQQEFADMVALHLQLFSVDLSNGPVGNVKDKTRLQVDDVISLTVGGVKFTYTLRSVVVHIGEHPDGGHYVTFLRSRTNKWYGYNDDSTVEVTDAMPHALGDGVMFMYCVNANVN